MKNIPPFQLSWKKTIYKEKWAIKKMKNKLIQVKIIPVILTTDKYY